MKKIATFLAAGFGAVSNAYAGPGGVGFSTFQISWSSGSVVPTAVPTIGTFGTLLLAVLLALVVYRISRNRGLLVRAIAPLATLGVIASFTVFAERPIAGIIAPPLVDANSCNGSETYTANGPTPPPCFVNSCGMPVTVTYTLVAAETGDGTPITEEGCTLAYFCAAEGEPEDPMPANDGALIPSDELSYGTAYCEEIFEEFPEE